MMKEKQASYRIKLWRARRINGFSEELVVAEFCPAKVNDLGIVLNKDKHGKEIRR